MWFVTDPDRTPDPAAIAARLPLGTGVIYRHFGRAGAQAMASRLAEIARGRGLVLLIGEDADLAKTVGAAGVHLPERAAGRARSLRSGHPNWLVTAAAHSERATHQAFRDGADAVFLSAIFPSRSPSAGSPLGVHALKRIVARARGPVYALGGVNARTAGRLVGTGAAGFAAIEAFSGLHDQ